MADGQHSRTDGGVPAAGRETARRASLEVSRRTLLGAVCASPLLRHPGLDSGPRNTAGSPIRAEVSLGSRVELRSSSARRNDGTSAVLEWDRALARFEKAQAAIAAVAGAPDHVYDPVGARHHAALARLLRTRAPDLPALARKLDLALDERNGEFDGDPVAMRMLKQDAHRLAAAAA